MDMVLSLIPQDERLVIETDVNGHVGEEAKGDCQMHGQYD